MITALDHLIEFLETEKGKIRLRTKHNGMLYRRWNTCRLMVSPMTLPSLLLSCIVVLILPSTIENRPVPPYTSQLSSVLDPDTQSVDPLNL
jgi:hypothetical protein